MLNFLGMRYFKLLLIFSLFVLFSGEEAIGSTLPEESRQCLKCHANQTYSYYNDWIEAEQKRMMNPFYIIDTTLFVSGVHGGFKCFDCHSSDYETYPHEAELKLEPMSTCIDCHGGDDTYADFQFERIEEEFQKSVHYDVAGEAFSCSKCHSQHYYTPVTRTSHTVGAIVSYSNDMCLSCHDNTLKYETVSAGQGPRLKQVHDWLPNQDRHFKSVRCIDCHTVVVDSLMVSHNIMNKSEALRDCNGCHSSNSLLKASLYKYENLQSRASDGVLGSVFTNEAYIIGANQNPLMKLLSLLLIGFTVLGIAAHWVLRVLKKK